MSKPKIDTTTPTTPTTIPTFDQDLLNTLTTTSSKIRYLDSMGLSRSQISKTLKIRYQWVRNVLITPIKKI